jgi:hypothetical protein
VRRAYMRQGTAACLRVALWRGTVAYGGSCIGRGKGKDRDCESATAVEAESSRLPGGDVEWWYICLGFQDWARPRPSRQGMYGHMGMGRANLSLLTCELTGSYELTRRL